MKAIILTLALLLFATTAFADARLDDDALMCRNIFGPFVKVDETLMEDGLMLESFSHTEDGPVILQTISIPMRTLDDPLDGYVLSNPLVYIIDLDSDGVIDYQLINKTEKQDCSVLEDFSEDMNPKQDI